MISVVLKDIFAVKTASVPLGIASETYDTIGACQTLRSTKFSSFGKEKRNF
jgi:hypothetical protein